MKRPETLLAEWAGKLEADRARRRGWAVFATFVATFVVALLLWLLWPSGAR